MQSHWTSSKSLNIDAKPEWLWYCNKTVEMDAGEVPNYQRVGHMQEETMHLHKLDNNE